MELNSQILKDLQYSLEQSKLELEGTAYFARTSDNPDAYYRSLYLIQDDIREKEERIKLLKEFAKEQGLI